MDITYLKQPASQQMLIAQFYNGIHNAWQTEYQNLGYPTQCRNIAISDGSECGKDQGFAPYAELLRIDHDFNIADNKKASQAWQFIGDVLLPFLGSVDGTPYFLINALDNQKSKKVYDASFDLKKTVNWFNIGETTTYIRIYSASTISSNQWLAWDNAPGGQYDINTFTGGRSIQSLIKNGSGINIPIIQGIIPNFCFVPTVSALDINTTNTAVLSSTSYLNSSTAKLSVFNNSNLINQEKIPNPFDPNPIEPTTFIFNNAHINFTSRNAQWLFNEMQNTPQYYNCSPDCSEPIVVLGDFMASDCLNSTQAFSIQNPDANTQYNWSVTAGLQIVGPATGSSINVKIIGNGEQTISVSSLTNCGTQNNGSKKVKVGYSFSSSDYPISGPNGEKGQITLPYGQYSVSLSAPSLPNATYQWSKINTDYQTETILYTSGSNNYYFTGSGNINGGQNYKMDVVLLRVGNACLNASQAAASQISILYPRSGVFLAAFPNPADQTLTLSAQQVNQEAVSEKSIEPVSQVSSYNLDKSVLYNPDLKLLNQYNQVIWQGKLKDGTTTISTSKLLNGFYYLKIDDGGNPIVKQILIQH